MVKNIRFLKRNMTRDDGYFYSFDEATDSVIQKTDDGTLAFAYPLDTPIAREVLSLEFDGESFWTLEHRTATPEDGFTIKRWVIDNFVMTLQQTFNFATNATDTFESSAFTIEKYVATMVPAITQPFGLGAGPVGVIRVTFDDDIYALITPGTRLFLGPSTRAGFVGLTESVTVASAETSPPGAKNLTLSSTLTNSYATGDPVRFSKRIWVFNEHFLKTEDVGGLYKINVLNGSILGRTQGGAFIGVNAAAFVNITAFPAGDLAQFNDDFLIFVRTNNLLFIDVLDSNLTTSLSSIQNNLSADTTTVNEVFDLAIEGNTLYRLQSDFNINGVDSTDAFNYQLATFKPFPTAISLTAVEAILPAESGGSTSIITAKVTDQYALPFGGGTSTIEFTTTGGGTGSGITPPGENALASTGIAVATYTTGDTAGLVTITVQVRI